MNSVSLANPHLQAALDWQEYLGQSLDGEVYLVAFQDEATSPYFLYEVGYNESDQGLTFQDEATSPYFLYEVGYNESDQGLTNVSGVFIPNIWAVALLEYVDG